MGHKSRRSGLSLFAAAATALGLVGGISATTPLHVPSVKHGVGGYRPGLDYRVRGYRPKPVPPEGLPDYQNYLTPLRDKNTPIDSKGVALWISHGRKLYHPLVIARYGIKLLHDYRITKMNPAYLDRAEVNANWLLNNAVSRHGAIYFPSASPIASSGTRAI